jgi:hypothetical protein
MEKPHRSLFSVARGLQQDIPVTMKTLALLLVGLLGCVQPLPPPSINPLSPPAVAEPDIFTDYVADCSDLSVEVQSTKATQFVSGCLDLDSGYNWCLVKAADSFSKHTIVCVTIDLNVEWQKEIAKDTASDMQRANAKHANDWIRSHRIGARR